MNTEKLFEFLGSKTEISAAFAEALGALIKSEIYKPHQILFAAGHQENRICFIENGFARAYFYDISGQEHTIRFWDSGNLLFSYEGYYGIHHTIMLRSWPKAILLLLLIPKYIN